MSIQNYKDLITSQHKTQPMFMAWLSTALTIVDDNITIINAMPSYFDIDSAIGVQLDVLGEIVGRSRVLNFQPNDGTSPTLDDANYRIALKAKVAQNQWDGTTPQIYGIWYSLFSNVSLTIVDNQNMTMAALIEGQLDAVSTELVASGFIIPKPAGVGLTIIEITSVDDPVYVGLLINEVEFITVTIAIP